jgi:hypothetical protein
MHLVVSSVQLYLRAYRAAWALWYSAKSAAADLCGPPLHVRTWMHMLVDGVSFCEPRWLHAENERQHLRTHACVMRTPTAQAH